MKIGHILVCLSVSPDKLMMSIPHDPERHLWFVYFHGKDEGLMKHLAGMVRDRGGNFYAILANRGLSISWNEGLRACAAAGCDLALAPERRSPLSTRLLQ